MESFESTRTESAVMQLLLASHPALVSRREIQREIGTTTEVDDALARFTSLGLVHRLDGYPGTGGFFWATRTAMAAEEATTSFLIHEITR